MKGFQSKGCDLPPQVSVVVLNYNGGKYLEGCFRSLGQTLNYPPDRLQLIMVDNGSTDGSVEYMRDGFPYVKIIPNARNLGFARGNNIGIRHALRAGAEYIALLNNDARVDREWLRELIEVAMSSESIGICGSKILTWDGKTIEYSGTVFHKATTAGGYTDEPDDGRYNNIKPAAYACGAALLLKSNMLRHVGLLDADYFAYHEDVDLSLRAWIEGYEVIYVPRSIAFHRRSGSSEGSRFRDYIGMRNALTTAIKCYQLETWARTYKAVLRTYLLSPSVPLKRAFLYNLLILPRTLIKRREVQRKRKITDQALFERVVYIDY